MLKQLTSHESYLSSLSARLALLSPFDKKRLNSNSFRKALLKVKLLNFNAIHPILSSLYSPIGRPAINQIEIIRSLFLMLTFNFTSITKWIHEIENDPLLCILCGFDFAHISPLGSYYDLMNRLYRNKDYNLFFEKDKNKKLNAKKLKKGEKLENVSKTDTSNLAEKYCSGDFDLDRPELILQMIFQVLALHPSIEKGLVTSTISGDGSALHIHSDSRGHFVNDKPDDIRRYMDPEANIGWDSDLGVYYFGHSTYFLASHNKEHSIDLPTFFTLVPASQHDSLTGITALAQFKNLNKDFKIEHFCLDSAHDNNATFNLCHEWNIHPIIDLNKRNTGKAKYIDEIILNENLEPVCQSGQVMTYWGNCKNQYRLKYRCPLVTRKIDTCPYKDTCQKTEYGRVIYIKSKENPRLICPIKYKSKEWKEIYKDRTSCERINTRVLNDYNIQNLYIHSKRRYFYFIMMACIHIHLDAWIKISSDR